MSAGERVPAWGVQTSIFRPGRPAFWAFAGLLAACALLEASEQSLYFTVAPAGVVVAWILLLAYLVPMALVIYRVDLYEREPRSLCAGAFAWGAVVATSAAALANQGWGIVVLQRGGAQLSALWGPALTAPFTEEILKGAGIVLLYFIAPREFDDVMDGFVYGALVGLGFTVVEDVYYFVVVFGGSPPAVVAGFFLRVLASGLYGHVLYSGMVGMGVAYFVTRRGPGRWVKAGALAASGVAFHFVWNSPLADVMPAEPWSAFDALVLVPLALAYKGVPLLLFVLLTLRLGLQRERRWLLRAALPEVEQGSLLAEELLTLEHPRRRRKEIKRLKARAGRRAARALRRLHKEQLNLVMIRTRVGSDEHPDLIRQRRRCEALREVVASFASG